MSLLMDHPDIASALATGYPCGYREPPILHCDNANCDCELEGSDSVYIFDGEKLCEDCCKAAIRDNFNLEEIAAALGITIRPAHEYAEEDWT